MSVAAVMLVKDEADVVGFTIGHLLSQLDRVYVWDNLSTDGTTEILEQAAADYPDRVFVAIDDEVAYRQAEKTTKLARLAYEDGFSWVVPCDADEFWRCHDVSVRIADALEGLDPEHVFARARLYDHKATALDDAGEPNPYLRMGWRFREPGKLWKVAVRLSPDVRIGMGNHEAATTTTARVSSTGSSLCRDDVLVVEHYSWRSEAQMLRKIRNGYLAYAAAPELSSEYGAHWRAFGAPGGSEFDNAVRSWFREWGYSAYPHEDPSIGFFPAPQVAE